MSEFIEPMGKVMFIKPCSLSVPCHVSAGYSINRSLRARERVSFIKRSEFIPKRKTAKARPARLVMSEYNEALIKAFEDLMENHQ